MRMQHEAIQGVANYFKNILFSRDFRPALNTYGTYLQFEVMKPATQFANDGAGDSDKIPDEAEGDTSSA
jgi:hypothetical protein